MILKPFRLLTATAASLALFFGLGVGQVLVSPTTMSGMNMGQMANGHCQSSCNLQSQPVAIRPASRVDEQNTEPQPDESYYIAFIGVGWATVIIVAAAYLLKYLHWRPPDLCKLNVAYRF